MSANDLLKGHFLNGSFGDAQQVIEWFPYVTLPCDITAPALWQNGIAKPLWNLYEVAAFAQSALPRNLEPENSWPGRNKQTQTIMRSLPDRLSTDLQIPRKSLKLYHRPLRGDPKHRRADAADLIAQLRRLLELELACMPEHLFLEFLDFL